MGSWHPQKLDSTYVPKNPKAQLWSSLCFKFHNFTAQNDISTENHLEATDERKKYNLVFTCNVSSSLSIKTAEMLLCLE